MLWFTILAVEKKSQVFHVGERDGGAVPLAIDERVPAEPAHNVPRVGSDALNTPCRNE